MKLNPPETAPKSDVIIANFGDPYLLPAVWNPDVSAWSVAITYRYAVGDSPWDVYFENATMEPNRLRGWFPLPAFDRPEHRNP